MALFLVAESRALTGGVSGELYKAKKFTLARRVRRTVSQAGFVASAYLSLGISFGPPDTVNSIPLGNRAPGCTSWGMRTILLALLLVVGIDAPNAQTVPGRTSGDPVRVGEAAIRDWRGDSPDIARESNGTIWRTACQAAR